VAWRDAESGRTLLRSVTLEDVGILEKSLERIRSARLIIIDPVSAYMGCSTDSHKNSEVRSLLAPVSDLAEKYRVAIIVVTHLNKASGSKAIYRATGSLAFAAAARAVFAITRDEADPDRRLMLPVKNNLAPDRNGLAFRLTPCIDDPNYMHVQWEPEPIDGSADEALNPAEDDSRREWQLAAEWLRELLADGPLDSVTVWAKAGEQKFGKSVVRRAKEYLGVRAQKSGYDKDVKWSWTLEKDEDAHP
jgi:hypothetical protein